MVQGAAILEVLLKGHLETAWGQGPQGKGEVVVWEGTPLKFVTLVLGFQEQDGRLVVGSCWPDEADE